MKLNRKWMLVISLVLSVAMATSGTLAYLQDQKADVNVMTLGSVYIEQIEQEWNADKTELVDFTQNKPLYPAVGAFGWTNDDANDGAYRRFTMENVVDKYVSVKNTGKSDAYVRTIIALEMGGYTTKDEFYGSDKVIGVSYNAEKGAEFDLLWKWNDWQVVNVNGNNYLVHIATWPKALAPEETTIPSLLQVYMSSKAGNAEVDKVDGNKNGTYDIIAVSQAVQTAGFETPEEALEAAYPIENLASWLGGVQFPSNVKVGSTDELKAALANAKEGQQLLITLTGDVEYATAGHNGADDITPAGSIVIDGQGKYTLTATGSGVTPIGDTSAVLTLKNLTVVDESVSYEEGAWEFGYLELGGAGIVCENVTFEDPVMFAGEKASLINCSFNGKDVSGNSSGGKPYNTQMYGAWVYNGNATFTNCTFEGTRGIKICDKYDGGEVGKVVVDNCLFEMLSQKPGLAIDDCDTQDMDITIKNSSFILCQPGDQGLYIYETDNTVPTLGTNFVTSQLIEVSSAAKLADALEDAADAQSGNSVIEITDDLDLSSINWTPIKVDGYNGADVVTIYGNGHTITGLKAPLFAGGFAGGSGIVIKDLTIADSNIVSTNTLGSGAFIESSDSMDTITLENCHLKNSTVTGGEGSRTGGLIGWTSGYSNVNDGPVKTYVTIKGCSVEDCTITCSGSVGGLYGHAGASDWTYSTIVNCTVKNNKLISTDNGGWRVGVVVGTANIGEVTITNITESGNTLEQTGKTAPAGQSNLYGRFVPGTTGKLTIDGVAIN